MCALFTSGPCTGVMCGHNVGMAKHTGSNVYVSQVVMQNLQPTAFRKWVASADTNNPVEEPVPGLREVLVDSGLSCFLVAAEKWCYENGAAFLSELVDELESVCSVFGPPGSEGLAPQLRNRLHASLVARIASEGSKVTLVDHKSAKVEIPEPQTAEQTDIVHGPVPGLREALRGAGLSCFIDATESWCYENGAAFLHELVDDMDDLCDNLRGLAPDLRARLYLALLAQCGIENKHTEKSGPCSGPCPAAVIELKQSQPTNEKETQSLPPIGVDQPHTFGCLAHTSRWKSNNRCGTDHIGRRTKICAGRPGTFGWGCIPAN